MDEVSRQFRLEVAYICTTCWTWTPSCAKISSCVCGLPGLCLRYRRRHKGVLASESWREAWRPSSKGGSRSL